MIKGQNDNSYRNIDSTTNVSNDIWQGSWDTRNVQWVENENYFITFQSHRSSWQLLYCFADNRKT